MKIQIKRIDDAYKMEATNETGEKCLMDGSKKLGAAESAFRPMQLLLTSLAGCSSIDVINILNKQRQRIDSFEVEVNGDREAGAVPAPFTAIEVVFKLKGKIKEAKIQKAIELTQGKYCSVYFSLNPDIDVTYRYELDQVE